MESYVKWNLVPDIGEEVFVIISGGGGFLAIVEKILGERLLVRRNIPDNIKNFFPNNTTTEIHSIKRIRVAETNKKRTDEIWLLKHSKQDG